MNELNKKLAEFVWSEDNVKLLWGHTDECGDFSLVPPRYKKEKFDTEQALCFLHPEKPYWQVVPDFPNDLNACFEWLVPKAIEEFGKVDVSLLIENWAYFVIYEGKKPAHLFCVALDRLISEHK